MSGEDKITTAHRSRRAVIYLRQSSEGQVRNNVESQRLQYALEHRARALGFPHVEVIDTDLGSSAAVAAKRREGFERLLGAVALGEVGVVLSRELSRLSRTDKDFCQLVELCQLFGTLIGDEESVYDTSRMDDQLVLGIKATISVVELKVLQLRLVQGKENKARIVGATKHRFFEMPPIGRWRQQAPAPVYGAHKGVVKVIRGCTRGMLSRSRDLRSAPSPGDPASPGDPDRARARSGVRDHRAAPPRAAHRRVGDCRGTARSGRSPAPRAVIVLLPGGSR